MIEAALPVGAVTDAKRRREFAHGVLVAVIQRPAVRIEAVFVSVSLELGGCIDRGVDREEGERDAPRRVLSQMFFDPHHVGHDRRAHVLG